VLPQIRLPSHTTTAQMMIDTQLDLVTDMGGEGLMLRKPESLWVPERVHNLLKLKRLDDGEGIVKGYITGRQTDKGSKLLGLMGAMILEISGGKRLELSGFTDAERALRRTGGKPEGQHTATDYAVMNPETELPDWIEATQFPRGSKVTFRHRGKTKDGIPMEARYWRQHEDSS